jgi:hypothetical protein
MMEELFKGVPSFQPAKGEKVLWEGRPSLRGMWVLYACGVMAVLCSLPFPKLLLATVPFLIACHLLALALRNATRFIVTNRRARSEFRFWVAKVREAELGMRTNVRVKQDAIQRILGVADVYVDTPFIAGSVRFWGISDYEEVLKALSSTRATSRT